VCSSDFSFISPQKKGGEKKKKKVHEGLKPNFPLHYRAAASETSLLSHQFFFFGTPPEEREKFATITKIAEGDIKILICNLKKSKSHVII